MSFRAQILNSVSHPFLMHNMPREFNAEAWLEGQRKLWAVELERKRKESGNKDG